MGRTRFYDGYSVPRSGMMPSIFSNVSDLIHGKLNLSAVLAYLLLSTTTWSFSTWSAQRPELFNAILGIWIMATSGLLAHFVIWAPELKLTLLPSSFQDAFADITHIGIGSSLIIIAQIFVRTVLSTVPLSAIKLDIGAETQIYVAAGVGEEYAFAFLIFPLLLFAFSSFGFLGIGMGLFADASIFALFHHAVKYVFYASDPTYLAAIFASRIVLDTEYLVSRGNLFRCIAIHALTNLFLSLVV